MLLNDPGTRIETQPKLVISAEHMGHWSIFPRNSLTKKMVTQGDLASEFSGLMKYQDFANKTWGLRSNTWDAMDIQVAGPWSTISQLFSTFLH